jgi:antitoxin component YwqK of YwqJK toxin-antitoxin module
MSGIQMTTENAISASSVACIIEQIKESQQKVLKAFEEHNILVNNSLELLNSHRRMNINGEMFFEKNIVQPVKLIKVKDPLEELKKINDTYKDRELYGYLRNLILFKITECLSLYESTKISATFKEIYLKLFNECIQFKTETEHILFNSKSFKESVLKVRDIRWLLIEMEKYPQIFQFTEDDLILMKESGASRDNIYLVKKFLKKDGDYEEMYNEEEGGGIKCQYHMTGGHLNGEYKKYYKDGQIFLQEYFKDGKREGEYKNWHINGELYCQEYYKEGNKEGESKAWNHDGQLFLQEYYKEGKLINSKHYIQRVLDLEKTLIENDTYELSRYYESTGKLHYKVMMRGGKWDGEYMSWWNSGKVCTKTTYKNGNLDGEWEYWNEDGTLKEKLVYKDGEKQV